MIGYLGLPVELFKDPMQRASCTTFQLMPSSGIEVHSQLTTPLRSFGSASTTPNSCRLDIVFERRTITDELRHHERRQVL